MMRTAKILGVILLGTAVLLMTGWMSLVVDFNLPIVGLRRIGAWALPVMVASAFVFLPNRRRTLIGFAVLLAVVSIGFLSIRPSNDRDWSPEYALLPHATYDGHRVTVHNVRNLDYRSTDDFDIRHYDQTYDLDQLQNLDLSFVYWGSDAIAHTILSFGFSDGKYLAVSVETRRERGEVWSSIGGFFKQYELTYVIADEADVLRLRTNFRGEDVYLYPLKTTDEQARSIFRSVLDKATALAESPEFYNTITQNCTTSLVPHFAEAIEVKASWLEILVNGYGDEVVYNNGNVVSDLPFAETKQRCHVNPLVADDLSSAGYSQRIRSNR